MCALSFREAAVYDRAEDSRGGSYTAVLRESLREPQTPFLGYLIDETRVPETETLALGLKAQIVLSGFRGQGQRRFCEILVRIDGHASQPHLVMQVRTGSMTSAA